MKLPQGFRPSNRGLGDMTAVKQPATRKMQNLTRTSSTFTKAVKKSKQKKNWKNQESKRMMMQPRLAKQISRQISRRIIHFSILKAL